MPTLGTYDLERVIAAARAAAGRKAIYTYGGSDGTWPNDLGGTVMEVQGNCTYTAATGVAHFPGAEGDFVITPIAPSWGGVGFSNTGAAPAFSASGWSLNGIRIICLMKVASGDLADRTLIHWKNATPGDETRWMVRFNASGQLEFWNQYNTDTSAFYQETPPGDRFFTIPVDLRPYLTDGNWHLFDFGRGTTSPQPESKRIMIDGEMVYQSVTGNGVNGFIGPDAAVAIGRALETTRTVDPVFDPATMNFKGDLAAFTICNSDGTAAEMTSFYQHVVGASGSSALSRSFGRFSRYLRGPR